MTVEARNREGQDAALVRGIGVRGLAATIFNVMVGGGIFLLPAVAAERLGPSAPLAYLVCAVAMTLIVACFAEAGSRVSMTGGPYAYVEVAFGRFVGFLAGVLLWLLGTFATAAVASGLASSLAVFWPSLASAVPRALIMAVLFALLAAINVRGVTQGTRLIEVVTVAKLLPLVLFVVIGMFAIRPEHLIGVGIPAARDLGRAAIVLIFAFAGVEGALVPSGEVRDPARTVPRALAVSMTAVTLLYIALQMVAQGILGPALANAKDAPLAVAAFAFAGAAGAGVLVWGAAISMFGSMGGMTLAMPRILFAFARDGIFPRWLAAVEPQFRTPHFAIVAQAAIACALAITNTFTRLAILANVSVLTLYLFCCSAAWVLRQRDVRAGGMPFRLPGGPVVPVLAILVILWLLSSATLAEMSVVAAVLAMAALVYLVASLRSRNLAPPASLEP